VELDSHRCAVCALDDLVGAKEDRRGNNQAKRAHAVFGLIAGSAFVDLRPLESAAFSRRTL
jgi:hypothetical protein